MKVQRLASVLTVINLAILIWILYHAASKTTRNPLPLLRGSGLEIVDNDGKRRAQIIVMPISTTAEGRKNQDTVLLRLIDPNGRPGVKIGASVDGSGMSLAGDSERRDWNGVQILAEETGASIILTNKDGHKQLIKP